MLNDAVNNAYQLLVEEEDARVCRDIPDAACREQPRAFFAQLLAQTLTKFGDALTSSRLVLAWILSSIGAPAFYLSLLVPLRESLSLLPQLFIAQWMREHAVRKWFWVWGSVGQALALAGMVAALLLLPGEDAPLAIVLLLALFSLARGVCSVAAKDVLGKTVSKSRRGRLTGLAASAAGLATLAVAVLLYLEPSLSQAQRPAGSVELFASLLGFAALLWCVAALVYAGVPEYPGATGGGGNAIAEALRSVGILASDAQFRQFVMARMLAVSTAFAIPYLVILMQRSGAGGTAELAILLFAEGAAGLLSGPFWGRWSDLAAHRVMAAGAAMSAAVIGVGLWCYRVGDGLFTSLPLSAALLFAAAIAHQGVRVGRKTYLVDMATADNRSRYTAVSNTVIGVFLLCGSGLGALDAAYGTASVLVLLLVVALLAMLASLRLPAVG